MLMTTPGRILQAAAIPVHEAQVCLITSRSGKRWVIPKGRLEANKTVQEIALQEAWEEAGLLGELHPHAVGTYVYEKWNKSYHVTVFLMEVTSVAEEWPERLLRKRCWLRPAQALARISDDGLHRVLQTVFAADEISGTFPSRTQIRRPILPT
jgi:8-oxo-dGTP pyrophosphatase MutT (NUDIX family)